MASLMPFDEINALKQRIEDGKQGDTGALRRDKGKYIDEVTDLLLIAYFFGNEDASKQLGKTIELDEDEARKVIEQPVAGKTYIERLTEYLEAENVADIDRVIETEAHRVYNQSAYEAAVKAGATMKTWETMQDPRVRDPHDYLQSVTIPIDAEFYTYNGDHAYYPGQFGVAEEDCNCRCWVTYR